MTSLQDRRHSELEEGLRACGDIGRRAACAVAACGEEGSSPPAAAMGGRGTLDDNSPISACTCVDAAGHCRYRSTIEKSGGHNGEL